MEKKYIVRLTQDERELRWPWCETAISSASTFRGERSTGTSTRSKSRSAVPPCRPRNRFPSGATATCTPSTSVKLTKDAISISSSADHRARSQVFFSG